MKNNIASYWWAFNPPTLWHFGVLQKLSTSKKVDKIIFTPDWERCDKKYSVNPEKRQEMMRVFLQDCRELDINIDYESNFLLSQNQTTTMDVERYFIDKYSTQIAHIFWIDVISSMPNWAWNIDKYLEEKLKKIFLMRKWYKIPDMSFMDNFEIIDLDIIEISSTTVREMLKNKLNVWQVLTPLVWEFVMDEKLYI